MQPRPRRLDALTGIRFPAAVWVVAYHSYHTYGRELTRQHPELMDAVRPVLSRGELALDVFFVLSGFVLGWNYLDKLGERLDRGELWRYVRLRVARIWPLYITMTLIAALLIWLRHERWGTAPIERLTWDAFARQVVMVQQWFSPTVSETSWDGPAWSISAEWLAYLALPLLVLLVWRLRLRAGASVLAVAAFASMVPLVVVMAQRNAITGDYMWLLRITCDFTAGLLLCAALSRVQPTERLVRVAGVTALAVPVAVVAWLYLTHDSQQRWLGWAALVLWLPLVAALAYGRGIANRVLESKALVLGGQISFALYLVHGPAFKTSRDVFRHAGVPLEWRPYAEMAVALGCVVAAYLLFRYVEEPGRKALTPAPRATPTAPVMAVEQARL